MCPFCSQEWVVGMEETFAEKVILELALEGKSVFIILLLFLFVCFFFFPDAILELEWD